MHTEKNGQKSWRILMQEGIFFLAKCGVQEEAAEAWYLFEKATGMSRTDYLLHRDECVDKPEASKEFQRLVTERGKRIPSAYLTGYRNFCGLDFMVNEAVLIPRQDTECLVEAVVPFIAGKRILDMCTGSGCIAISLVALGIKSGRIPRDVTGVDVSKEALKVARENERKLLGKKLDEAVPFSWLQSNLFEQVQGCYDIILSNPPYIPSGMIKTLEPEVRNYEPRLALDGHEDGLYFYRKIIQAAPVYLIKGGLLAFEIGYDQGEAVSGLVKQAGFRHVEVRKDLAGLDRMVLGWF